MGSQRSKITTLNKREFKQKIFDYSFSKEWKYKGGMPAVVDFYADWCAPCKAVAPILNQLSEEYDGRVNFYKVNTEKDPQVSKVFGISSIPTLLFISPTGKPVLVKGAQSKQALKRNIEKILPKSETGFFKNLAFFSRKNTGK